MGFIRNISNIQWLIENGRLSVYRCNYERFVKQRVLDRKKIEKDWDLYEKQMNSIKCKGTPAAKKQAEELAQKAAIRPQPIYSPKFFFESSTSTSHTALIRVEDIVLGYESSVILSNINFALYQGSRVALVGQNGSGKSTFLKFLSDELSPFSGGVHIRNNLKVVKFDQHFYHSLPEDKTPLEYIDSAGARRILGASGLDGRSHTQQIRTLSGGQKARVYFASIAVQQPDILLMDEPTNHLDLETIDALIAGLTDYPGAAIIVSHDINFLESVATEVWQTANGTVTQLSKDIEGLSTYISSVEERMDI